MSMISSAVSSLRGGGSKTSAYWLKHQIVSRPLFAQQNSSTSTTTATAKSSSENGGSSSQKRSSGSKWKWAIAATAGLGLSGGLLLALEQRKIFASELILHPQTLPWTHKGWFEGQDIRSVRRGFQVYRQVCAACHSLTYQRYYYFVDKFLTEEEAKAFAEEGTIADIDEVGNPIERPRALIDSPPPPYPNKKAAAAANGGAIPPDLTNALLTKNLWTGKGEDYVFHLLTGYQEPPAGVEVEEGKAYNPYFEGGVLSMPQQLFDEMLEYDDGTPATVSQMAKDICSFLRMSCDPWHDERKRLAFKSLAIFPFVTFMLVYWRRKLWTILRTQKVTFKTVKGREPPADKPLPRGYEAK